MEPRERELDRHGRRLMVATRNDPEPTLLLMDAAERMHRMGRWWAITEALWTSGR